MKSFFFIVFAVYLLVNSYLFFRGWQALPASGAWKWIYPILFLFVFSSFIVGLLGRESLPSGIQQVFIYIGTTWLTCMLYLTLFFLLTDLVRLTDHFFHFLPGRISGNPHLFHQIQVSAGIILTMGLLITGYSKFNNPVTETYPLKIEKTGINRKTLRIIGISDIHLGVIVGKGRLSRYVNQINSLKPDIILIAGDIIDNSVFLPEQKKMYEELNQLEAPLGVYACLGNHEYISHIDASLNFLSKTKIHILKDQAVCVDSCLYVIGRDDRSNPERKTLTELVAGLDKSKPIFLLDHQPYHLEEAEQNGIDLQFSGHTHNAQLWPFNLLIKNFYEVSYGYKKKGNSHFYVSSGIALWGPPYRIGTQSEIVLFDIRFQDIKQKNQYPNP